MMAYELANIPILNVKGIDYRFVTWNITKNDAINRLDNSELDDQRIIMNMNFGTNKSPI